MAKIPYRRAIDNTNRGPSSSRLINPQLSSSDQRRPDRQPPASELCPPCVSPACLPYAKRFRPNLSPSFGGTHLSGLRPPVHPSAELGALRSDEANDSNQEKPEQ